MNLGLVSNGHIYRIVLECDALGCGSKVSIDSDAYFVDRAPEGIDVLEQHRAAFLRGTHGAVITGKDGVSRYYCEDHLPKGV